MAEIRDNSLSTDFDASDGIGEAVGIGSGSGV
jgi:hypothetical protein